MKTQWEYDLVEKPFCEQLKGMGWDWLEGDTGWGQAIVIKYFLLPLFGGWRKPGRWQFMQIMVGRRLCRGKQG